MLRRPTGAVGACAIKREDAASRQQSRTRKLAIGSDMVSPPVRVETNAAEPAPDCKLRSPYMALTHADPAANGNEWEVDQSPTRIARGDYSSRRRRPRPRRGCCQRPSVVSPGHRRSVARILGRLPRMD